MIRKAFIMHVHPGREAEYERRHRPIWAELEAVLRAHGVHDYSIHLDATTHTLFGYDELHSEEHWQAVARTEVCGRWWRHVADVMPTNPDARPVSRELREVFHLG